MDSMSFPQGAPPIAIVPLGTGNDLSRSLNWGGKYRDKPLRKVLLDIAKADVVHMDRWTLRVTPNDACSKAASAATDTNEPMSHCDDKLVRNFRDFFKSHESGNDNFDTASRKILACKSRNL